MFTVGLDLSRLARIIDTDATMLPSMAPFLKRGIVKLAMNLNHAIQRLALLLIRIKTVLVVSEHCCISDDPRRQCGVLFKSTCAFGGHVAKNPQQDMPLNTCTIAYFLGLVKCVNKHGAWDKYHGQNGYHATLEFAIPD